jgi:hypothetical protein
MKRAVSLTNGGIIQEKINATPRKKERKTKKTANPRETPFLDNNSTGCFAALMTIYAINRERRTSFISQANLMRRKIPKPIRIVFIDISIFGAIAFSMKS